MGKSLHIPKAKQWKGLKVVCSRCNSDINDICKETGKSIQSCRFGDKHAFKVYVHVPGTKNTRKTKTLLTRDVNEAIKQAIEFENLVKRGHVEGIEISNPNQNGNSKITNQPYLLVHALARYVGWLNNEGVPEHRIKERSLEHIKDVKRSLVILVECLKKNGYDLNTFSVAEINDPMIGKVYEYLFKEKHFGNRNFNKYFGYYTSFLKWYSKEYDYPLKNWFEGAERKKLNSNPNAINHDEFVSLLNSITPKNGVRKYVTGVKPVRQLYKPWLKDAFRLGLYTGRRREEITSLRFCDIIKNPDGTEYIKVEDYKVNRIQNRKSEEEKKYIYIPVTNELETLLLELGLEKYKGSLNFILAPEVIKNRTKSMSDAISKGFSHYYDQLDTGRKLTFKSLRKAYITSISIYMGGNAKAITQHSGDAVIEKHYLDKQAIATAAQGFEVFPKETTRNSELKNLREVNEIKSKEQEKGK